MEESTGSRIGKCVLSTIIGMIIGVVIAGFFSFFPFTQFCND